MPGTGCELIGLFDMDNTLFDYDAHLMNSYAKLMAPGEQMPERLHDESAPHIKARVDLIKNQPGWWRTMPLLRLGQDVLEIALKLEFDITILTKGPWSRPQAWAEKVESARRHFGDEISIDIVGRTKAHRYGRFLVDDWPPYCEDWLSNRLRGLVIMPAHKYNEGFVHPRVIRYDGTNIEEVGHHLKAVKARKSGESWKDYL